MPSILLHWIAPARDPRTDRSPAISVALPYIDGDTLFRLLSLDDTIAALAAALDSDPDLEAMPPRSVVPVDAGQLLLMPAESEHAAGVKLVSVAPGNPSRGLLRIQAFYILLDGETLTPTALMDGTTLTVIRTTALSALAVRQLAIPDARRLTVFGSGPQAEAHVHAMREVRPIEHVQIVARNGIAAAAMAGRLRTAGISVRTAKQPSVRDADIVVCATSARQPLFDAGQLTRHACVVAIGSHEPDARELSDGVFVRASRVVVEDRRTAMSEAGDVIQAMVAGALTPEDLIPIADLASLPAASDGAGITVFKSVGMGWQDLAVAEAALTAWRAANPDWY